MTLRERYQKEIRQKLLKELGLKNINSVPALDKIKVNIGIGTYMRNNKNYDEIAENIAMITGQKPVVSKSRIAISNFKLRIGMPVGLSVTLRKQKMYDFMERLVNIVLPRVRDFQGVSPKSFDQKGNYNLGLKDCSVFPELNIEDIAKIHGLQITITTTADNAEHGKALLQEMGFPFKKNN